MATEAIESLTLLKKREEQQISEEDILEQYY